MQCGELVATCSRSPRYNSSSQDLVAYGSVYSAENWRLTCCRSFGSKLLARLLSLVYPTLRSKGGEDVLVAGFLCLSSTCRATVSATVKMSGTQFVGVLAVAWDGKGRGGEGCTMAELLAPAGFTCRGG